jgi:hypothetical protein
VSRLDELKLRLTHLKAGMGTIEKCVDTQRLEIMKTMDEIARLEAESARPRRFKAWVDRDGNLTTVPCSGGWGLPYIVNNVPIDLIESKPLVITREMAESLDSARELAMRDKSINGPCLERCKSPQLWRQVLKAAGIDAVPEG